MLRVLVITYYWPPAGGAGVQRWLKLCKYLPENGVLPTVITVRPEKATYPQLDESLLAEVREDVKVIRTDSFEPLQIYGKLFGKEKVPYGGFANVSNEGMLSKISRFVRGNFFIPDARKGWNKYAYRTAKKELTEQSIDVVITTGPPHSTHLVGLKLKKELGVKWVADFRDPWSDIYYNDLMLRTKSAKRKDAEMERAVIEKADRVVANCESNQKLLRDKVGDHSKFETVENGFDAEDFRDFGHEKTDTFNVLYTGTMAGSYEPEAFLRAFQEFNQKVASNSVFHLAGNVAPELSHKIENLGLENAVMFHGYVSHVEVLKLLRSAHVLLNIFPKTTQDKGIPGKLFEYLAAGKPILNMGPREGDAAVIIDRCNSGTTVGRDQSEIFRALCDFHKDWQGGITEFGNEFVHRYSRQSLSEKYGKVLRALNFNNIE